MIQEDPNIGNIIGSLLENYGPLGVGFGILLYLILKRNKGAEDRVVALEAAQQAQYEAALKAHKEMIDDYILLAQNQTKALSDLTGCLNAIKNTLERLERKNEN